MVQVIAFRKLLEKLVLKVLHHSVLDMPLVNRKHRTMSKNQNKMLLL